MHAVLAHAQLAAGRLDSARATAERALAGLAQIAGLRQTLGRSTAPSLCSVWWAMASAYLGKVSGSVCGLQELLAYETEEGLHALYGTHGFLCEVLRLRGDLTGALAHGRRAIALAEERGSPFSRVEAGAFLGAAALAAGDVAAATSALEAALGLGRTRRTALWYEPRILATLAEARSAAGDRAGARALLEEARAAMARGQGWRLAACDVELARIRFLAAEPVPTATRSSARSTPWRPWPPSLTPTPTGGWPRSSAPASLSPPRPWLIDPGAPVRIIDPSAAAGIPSRERSPAWGSVNAPDAASRTAV